MAASETLSVEVVVAPGGQRPPLEMSFQVRPGVTALFGPSGAGKSTCLSLIAGLLRPDRGRIAIGDEVLFDAELSIALPVHLRRVGLVFQSLALFPQMSAQKNVEYGISRHIPSLERRRIALRWLERMRVEHVASRRPATFSGGESQRVALARALAAEPRVLLLDEPFTALDDALRSELASEMLSIVDELRIPTLLVTHSQRDALRLASAVVLLREGRVVTQGTSEILTTHASREP